MDVLPPFITVMETELLIERLRERMQFIETEFQEMLIKKRADIRTLNGQLQSAFATKRREDLAKKLQTYADALISNKFVQIDSGNFRSNGGNNQISKKFTSLTTDNTQSVQFIMANIIYPLQWNKAGIVEFVPPVELKKCVLTPDPYTKFDVDSLEPSPIFETELYEYLTTFTLDQSIRGRGIETSIELTKKDSEIKETFSITRPLNRYEVPDGHDYKTNTYIGLTIVYRIEPKVKKVPVVPKK